MFRNFSKSELAFFAVPRSWREIELRFPCRSPDDERDLRDAIIQADDDGGFGFIKWHADKQSWCLTDRGKQWVGKSLVTAGAKESPAPAVPRGTVRKEIDYDAIFGDPDDPADSGLEG